MLKDALRNRRVLETICSKPNLAEALLAEMTGKAFNEGCQRL
jgi:hypothetical protein